MDQLIDAFRQLIEDHWIKFVTAAGFTALGWLVARWRADREWKRREFFNRINFSLNMVRNGTLLIRTLAEKSCEDVFLNPVAAERLKGLAQKTSPENPLVPVPQEDAWYYLNAALNELSEQFAEGLIRQDMGGPVRTHRYVICLTNECDGAIRTRKIRVMVVRKELLLGLTDEPPKLEKEHHSIRLRTLQHMQKVYETQPWNFLELELSV